MAYIRSLKICKLFGYRDVTINHNEDCLILVGENGSGKSTIMNCLYYVLTKQFEELIKIDFESIEIVFYSGKKFFFKHKDIILKQSVRLNITERRFVNSLNESLTESDIKTLFKLFESTSSIEDQMTDVLQFIKTKKIVAPRFVPETIYYCVKALYEDIKAFFFSQSVDEMDKYLLNAKQIFHLTTYRRVEAQLENNDNAVTSNEIAYGMKDVDKMLKDIQQEINESNKVGFNQMMISLLNKLVSREQAPAMAHFDLSKVEIVLSRLGDQLSGELRQSIIDYCKEPSKNNRELDYLIEELIKLYEQQEDLDNAVAQFCNKCNKYLNGKRFEYDVSNVQVFIRSLQNGAYIGLESLSSGEKQMIGLMAKMYLSKEEDFVVLIDEPELSLSIQWQEHILEDIVESGKIKYLMAVTHSPFIYNNTLSRYALGMSNFIKDNL